MTDQSYPSSYARDWSLRLTSRPSISGTEDEIAFAPWLIDELHADPAFANAQIWSFPVAEGDARRCVAMLVRGSGRQTAILTGHFDTVTIEDYGTLRDVATQPDALLQRLRADLAETAQTPAERRALDDFQTDDWIPGRGLLDMKSGLAAGLAVCAQFTGNARPAGNLLFLAVPDEEVNSVGARGAASILPSIAREYDLAFAACINLDAIADNSPDGHRGRVIALGTIGKLLPTAYVVGVPAHSGYPLAGLNAGALAGAIAAAVEWSPELTDDTVDGLPGTFPSLLSLHDGKPGYDVTTPGTAFAIFNVLSYQRQPSDVLDRFEALCRAAAADFIGKLLMRKTAGQSAHLASAVDGAGLEIYRYEAVLAAAVARRSSNEGRLTDLTAELAALPLSLPEKCRRITALAWELSGLSGPAIVIGFGSIPYLPTSLSQSIEARALHKVCLELAEDAEQAFGTALATTPFFAGISDMSFFGEADEAALGIVSRNTPAWAAFVRWPESGAIANIPTINFGPWGRDYHTRLERLYAPYAFSVLPRMLTELVSRVLKSA